MAMLYAQELASPMQLAKALRRVYEDMPKRNPYQIWNEDTLEENGSWMLVAIWIGGCGL
jgi:hypothetical protein